MAKSMVVVRQADEVECFLNEDGDVLLARKPHEWEDCEQVSIMIPRACVPGLIEHLQSLLSDGDVSWSGSDMRVVLKGAI